jgi:hypothetical protein
VRGLHGAITGGNVPDVDVIVASHDGAKLLSLQVKTSRNAHRAKRYGYELREWDVGASAVGRSNPGLWYAFVDLQEADGSVWGPTVFLVPSLWVGSFVREDFSRKMYLLRSELWSSCQDRWDRIEQFFEEKEDTLNWADTVPPEARNW